jgi:N-formylglutamate deformylase
MTFQTDLPPFIFEPGGAPLLLSLPHSGTHIPAQVADRMTDEARRVPDTDWHLETLYGFARELGVSVLRATHSRYVIDVNRPPDAPDRRLGERVTGVCPVDTFDVTPIYRAGQTPSDDEVAARRDAIWHPYHSRLAVEVERLHVRGLVGQVVERVRLLHVGALGDLALERVHAAIWLAVVARDVAAGEAAIEGGRVAVCGA